jgi:hypothetical protein
VAVLSIGSSPATASPLRFDAFKAYGAGGGQPRSVVSADFNQDNKPDFAIGNYGIDGPAAVTVRLGKGDGTFGPASSIGTAGSTNQLVVDDFNSDGDPDIAAGRGDGKVSVFLGGAGASFDAQTPYETGGINFSLVSGQFDAPNTSPDLATGSSGSNGSELWVLLGAGDGTFGSPTSYPVFTQLSPSLPLAGALADFNGDGDPDVALTDLDSPDVIVMPGATGGTFGTGVFSDAGAGAQSMFMAAGDFDTGSDPDLVLSGLDDTLVVLLGSTGATFAAPVEIDVKDQTDVAGVATGDFDGDGSTDIAAADSSTARNGLAIALGNGDGTFGAAKIYGDSPLSPRALTTGDFNRDGHPDFALAAPSTNQVSILLSDYSKPNTKITKQPPNTVTSSSVTYKFTSNQAGSIFKCKLDGSKFKRCKSADKLAHLKKGDHTFQVRATDPAGNTDSSPAKDSFKVK